MLGSLGAAEPAEDAPAEERADHHDVAVSEVEQLEDPVDQREAERDEGIDAPQRHAVDQAVGRTCPSPRAALISDERPSPRRGGPARFRSG